MASAQPGPSGRAIYKRLLRYAFPYWRMFAISVVGMIGYAATEPALASLMKPLLDGSFVERDPEVVRVLPFYMIGLFLIRGITGFVYRRVRDGLDSLPGQIEVSRTLLAPGFNADLRLTKL